MTGTSVFSLLGKLAIDGVDETKKALDDVAKGGEDAKNKLSISFQDIGNKAGELGKKMALGLAGAVTASVALVESTREFRQDLGKLETAFGRFSANGLEQGLTTFKELYAVLGEDDTAIEAANNLAALTGDEKTLAEYTHILTGVYATFGDSLPIEGLAEAVNETARVGTVTGGLADALNWAGESEEEFNAKLEKCNSTAEREALIRETLTDLYGESATVYKEVNGDVMANNTAQAELNLQLADAAAKIEPLVTKGKIFLAEVLQKLTPIITWIIDNINILAPIVLGFMGALFALNIAAKIQAFIPIVKTLFTLLKANPIGLVITAISLLVTAFIYLWNNCEGFRNFWINLWEKLKSAFNMAVSAIKNGIENVKNFFSNLKENITSRITAIKEGVTNTFNKIKTAITSPIEKARDVVKGVIDKIKGFFKFNVSLPKIKLPHFGITPKGWQIGDLLKGSIPKLGIDWYAKAVKAPMLLDKPTAFGISPNGNIQVGGEAGSEIVGGTSTIMGMISNAVSSNNGALEEKLDRVIGLLTNYLPVLTNKQLVATPEGLVEMIVDPMDVALGELAYKKRRGR